MFPIRRKIVSGSDTFVYVHSQPHGIAHGMLKKRCVHGPLIGTYDYDLFYLGTELSKIHTFAYRQNLGFSELPDYMEKQLKECVKEDNDYKVYVFVLLCLFDSDARLLHFYDGQITTQQVIDAISAKLPDDKIKIFVLQLDEIGYYTGLRWKTPNSDPVLPLNIPENSIVIQSKVPQGAANYGKNAHCTHVLSKPPLIDSDHCFVPSLLIEVLVKWLNYREENNRETPILELMKKMKKELDYLTNECDEIQKKFISADRNSLIYRIADSDETSKADARQKFLPALFYSQTDRSEK